MRVEIRHAVPVRWRPPRSPGARRSLLAVRTVVEVPEVPAGTLEETVHQHVLDEGPLRLSLHAGKAWQRPLANSTSLESWPWWRPGALEAELRSDPRRLGAFAPCHTPLRAAGTGTAREDAFGQDLPDAILNRSEEDHAADCRAALSAYVSGRVVTDGRYLYLALPVPVVAPHVDAWNRIARAPVHPRLGPSFERERLPLLRAYLDAAPGQVFGDPVEQGGRCLPRVPGSGDDLARFLGSAPLLVEEAAAAAGSRARTRGERAPDLAGPLARVAPLADLGLVGALPPARYREAAEAIALAAEAVAEAMPGRPSPALGRVIAYARTVALAVLPAPAIPVEDAASLAGLGPGA